MNISILGGATSKFGELWHISPRDLVRTVVSEALMEADLKADKIEAIYVGNMLSGILGSQEHLGAFFAEELNIQVPAVKVEGACASGGLAVHLAVLAISSGMYENVLVLGVEKMTDHPPEEVAKALMGAGSESERTAGATFPALYAMMARAHMEKYGTTEEELAAVAVKNHFHASLNSRAQFPFSVSLAQVMESSCVASPLKLLDCSPISDGAAALILSGRKNKTQKIRLSASTMATDTLGLTERADLTVVKSAITAVNKAYRMVGISAKDIDVAEVHDCFTIAEIIAMEDLGFFEKGKAGKAIVNGQTTLGKGKLVVNPSGGLKACGHPVGATGVKQVVEIYHQLKGNCDSRQVKNAKLGLTHNVGGSGATAVIHILQK
jgi:acetyl-CoA C-acetyltransferase